MLLLASSVSGLFKWRQFEPEVILLVCLESMSDLFTPMLLNGTGPGCLSQGWSPAKAGLQPWLHPFID